MFGKTNNAGKTGGMDRDTAVKTCLKKHFGGIHAAEPTLFLFCDDAAEIASLPSKGLELYTDEEPLLIFQNTKNLKNGIVITTNAIYTAFLGQIQVLRYYEIDSGWCGKAGMFKGMKFNLRSGEESKAVDLSSLNDPIAFVDRLNAFLAELPEQEPLCVTADEATVTALLTDACRRFGNKEDISIKIGTPLSPDLPKYKKAVEQFLIPADEAVYAIYDETLFGSCKVGFALTPKGLYYRQNKKTAGHYAWEALCGFRIYSGSVLDIGPLTFYCSTSDHLAKVIKAVCEGLKN